VLAESFRILRTNLQYLFVTTTNKEEWATSIFVTSTVTGERNTFLSVNLALTLANSVKKGLLVGAGIRNPQLQRNMSENQKKQCWGCWILY
jgi:Mrp family chromosome partitioning ATPase